MATAHSVGGFAQGFLGGLEQGQMQRRRALEIEKEERLADEEKRALDLSQRIASQNPQELAGPQRELEGPTQDGSPLMTRAGSERIQQLRNEANALTGPAREERLAQLNDVAFRTAALNISMAAQARQDPEQEAKFLNEASGVLGTPAKFEVGADGKVTSQFGPVDEKTYAFLHHYATNPEKAYEWAFSAGMAQRKEGREQTALDSEVAVNAQRIESMKAEAEQGAERLDILWGELGLRGDQLGFDKDKWKDEYSLKRDQLKLDEKLVGAQADYYSKKAAEASATAAALGAKGPWEKASDLNTAIANMNKQVADSNAQQFSPEYMEAHGIDADPENFRMAVGTIANEALVEHGPGSQASALQGSLAVTSFLAGDKSVGIRSAGIDEDTGRAFIKVGDPNDPTAPEQSYPISRNALVALQSQKHGADRAAAAAAAAEANKPRGAIDVDPNPTRGIARMGPNGIEYVNQPPMGGALDRFWTNTLLPQIKRNNARADAWQRQQLDAQDAAAGRTRALDL